MTDPVSTESTKGALTLVLLRERVAGTWTVADLNLVTVGWAARMSVLSFYEDVCRWAIHLNSINIGGVWTFDDRSASRLLVELPATICDHGDIENANSLIYR